MTRDLQRAETPESPAPPDGEPTQTLALEEIRAALERVRKSAALAGSEKLIQFLTFIVETTIGGAACELKETIIGISVFGRSPDYDPKADTIVRSQAWRLRAKLADYYRSEGADDPVIIDLRKGSYVPVFLRRNPDTASSERLLRRTG